MGESIKEPEVTDKELEKLVFIYNNLSEVERSQIVYGANLLYASSKARNEDEVKHTDF